MKPFACISIDVDTLSSIYKGKSLARESGYSFIELRSGLENIQRFYEPYGIKTTLFMVGTDFLPGTNHPAIRNISDNGHEIANHSMTHPQGFRWLDAAQKEKEISDMAEICRKIMGITPIGFRSPGWNMDDSALPVLKKLGYQYDSSVFPTLLMPVMKVAHWLSMSRQPKPSRTTMGMWRYMLAPIKPYKTSKDSLASRGSGGIIEFPVSVTPVLRIPFFATLLLFLGNNSFQFLYRWMRKNNLPIHFQMHLSDFVDYSMPELQDQMPSRHQGAYIPQALSVPLNKKLDVFKRMIDMIACDYSCITLKEWAQKVDA